MVVRDQFIINTTDGKQIQVYKWKKNDVPVKGIVQIAHGMVEHAQRYEDFSRFLASNGFLVYANDHRGHGRSIKDEKKRGFFAKRNGFQKVVEDFEQITSKIRKNYPNTPLFLFGHSMGSFIVRRYVQLYNHNIAGIVLSGTGGDPKTIGKIGLLIAKIERRLKGHYKKSPFMDRLIFGNYNKQFSPARTKFDFLTRDEKVVDRYIADPNCGFICTTSFYVDLLTGIQTIHQQKEYEKTPKSLPIFLLSGDKDPVGNNGEGVQSVYEQYIQSGSKHVSIKLYKEGRHEMLNEFNKKEVYHDIIQWLHSILQGINKNGI